MRARQRQLIQTLFPNDAHKICQIVDEDGSDSAIVDNALEFLTLAMEPEQAAMLLYQNHGNMTKQMMQRCVHFMNFIAT